MRRIVFYLPILVMVPAICPGQDEAAQSETEVFLDPGIVFTLKDGETVEIDGGIYQLRAAGPDSLQLRSGDEVLEIEAEPLELEEGTLGTDALSFEDEAGVQHLVIAQPDGSVLSSIGRKEPAVELRGTATTTYVTADRTKAIAAATESVRIASSKLVSTSRISPPRIEVFEPVKGVTWVHGNEYKFSWKSTDGTLEKVGDQVYTNLVRSDGLLYPIQYREPNDGAGSFVGDQWLAPGTYQVVVTSAANRTIIGKSQPFSVRVAKRCQTGGTVVNCGTYYWSGFKTRTQTYITVPGTGWKKVWTSVEPIYKANGGQISVTRSSSDSFGVHMYSGGYETTYKCGWLGRDTCRRNVKGLVSATVYVHASK